MPIECGTYRRGKRTRKVLRVGANEVVYQIPSRPNGYIIERMFEFQAWASQATLEQKDEEKAK